MNDIITKPIRRKAFITTVDYWINAAREALKETPPQKAGKSKKKTSEEQEVIHYRQALEEFDGDRELLDRLLDRFMENLEKQIPSLFDSLDKGDAKTLLFEAHRIKGGAGNLTAFHLAAAAAKLEAAAEKNDLKNAGRFLVDLKNEFEKLKESLTKLRSS